MPVTTKDIMAVAALSTVTTVDATTKASPAVDMRDFEEVCFIISTTDANADTTIDAKGQEDDNSGFSSPSDITSLAITQFTAAATAKGVKIWVRREDMTQRYARVLVTAGNGTTGAEISIVAVGFRARFNPPADVSEVVENVALYGS